MSFPYRQVLVTGGCGFVGSNLIRYLLAQWSELRVINLDALTYAGNPENLTDLAADRRYRFVHGRVEDGALLEALFAAEPIEAVIHLAAESHVDRSILGPEVFVTTNVIGTQVLLDAALRAGVKRLLYASSDEIYGSAPPDVYFDEEIPFRPSSPYAATKGAADLLVLAYAHTYGMNVVVTRASNTYGPYQFPEKLIPLIIINALEDQPIPVYGDGLQARSWLHVEDHCRALCAALMQGRAAQAYNIGGDCRWCNLELITEVLNRMSRPRRLITHVADRPGHDRRYALDSRKAEQELGWQAQRTLEHGLAETITWYLEHPSWWQRVRDGSYRQYYQDQYGSRLRQEQTRLA